MICPKIIHANETLLMQCNEEICPHRFFVSRIWAPFVYNEKVRRCLIPEIENNLQNLLNEIFIYNPYRTGYPILTVPTKKQW